MKEAEASSRTTENPQRKRQGFTVIPGGIGAGPLREGTPIVNPVGKVMSADHRYWFNGAGPFPSVTAILDVVDRSGPLVWWAKDTVARFAVQVSQSGQLATQIEQVGSEATAKWLASLPDYQRDQAADIGTSVHLLANLLGASQDAVDGFQIGEGVQVYLDAFRGFLARYSASSIVSSEKSVLHSGLGYAGTYDLICKWPTGMGGTPQLWLVDIKTGKGPRLNQRTQVTGLYYPETVLQLAAYGMADGVILENDPKLYPFTVQRYGVLHLRPDKYPDTGYRLIEYPVTDRDRQAFTSALDLWQWRKEGKEPIANTL